MKLKLEYLAVCLIVATFWGYAEAIKCYQCTSAYDPACGEHFKKDEIPSYDCNLSSPPRWLLNILGNQRNATGCMKHVRMLNGKTNIERSCFYGNISDKSVGCSQDPSSLIPTVPVSCYVCSGELCNSAPTSMVATSIGAITTLGVVLMKLF